MTAHRIGDDDDDDVDAASFSFFPSFFLADQSEKALLAATACFSHFSSV